MLHKLNAIEIDFHTNPDRGQEEMMDIDDNDENEKPFIKKDFICFKITNLPKVSVSRKMHFEAGGKIIMPERVLSSFVQDDFSGGPLIFRMTYGNIITHCGVLEFTAEADTILMPTWMMESLKVAEGNIVTIESIELPKATRVKLKMSSDEFLQRYDPKPTLEAKFAHFTCLTEGDKLSVHVNGGVYKMTVIQTEPGSAVCIVDCDLNVEFDELPGSLEKGSNRGSPYVKHIGIGRRLDEKQLDKAGKTEIDWACDVNEKGRGSFPDLSFTPGNIRFERETEANNKIKKSEKNGSDWSPFCGEPRSLK